MVKLTINFCLGPSFQKAIEIKICIFGSVTVCHFDCKKSKTKLKKKVQLHPKCSIQCYTAKFNGMEAQPVSKSNLYLAILNPDFFQLYSIVSQPSPREPV